MKSNHARETDSGVSDEKTKTLSVKTESRPATIESAKETFWMGAQQNFCKILNEPLCDRILTSSLEQLRAETIKEVIEIIEKEFYIFEVEACESIKDKNGKPCYGVLISEFGKFKAEVKQKLEAMGK